MFSKMLIVQILLIFIDILIVYFTFHKGENANQTKYSALDFTKCFVSQLDTPDHYEK